MALGDRAPAGKRQRAGEAVSRRTGSSADESLEVFHHQEQVKRIGWAGIEVKRLIPALGLLVLRMYYQRPDAGDLRRLGGAQKGVFQERTAKDLPLLGSINGEAGQDHDRNRVSGTPFAGVEWRHG